MKSANSESVKTLRQDSTVEPGEPAQSAEGRATFTPPADRSQPAQFRMVLVSFLAGAIGLVAGLVAYALYKLIGLFTNLFFFHEWSTTFRSVGSHHLGAWVILVPVIGGVIVGVMAEYGSSKIKGHGIPEAM